MDPSGSNDIRLTPAQIAQTLEPVRRRLEHIAILASAIRVMREGDNTIAPFLAVICNKAYAATTSLAVAESALNNQ